MKRIDYIATIIIILALHLLFVNSEIIIKLLDKLSGTLRLWQKTGAILFALSYSLITVLIIKVYPQVWMFGLTALFDGFAVYLNYAMPGYFALAAAIYLGIYTSLIIIATGFLERQTTTDQTQTELIRKLTKQKQSLQQAIRRLKDENQKQEKLKQLKHIQDQLQALTNQN